MTTVSSWIIPLFLLIVLSAAMYRKVPSYELFVEGGKEGVKMAFSLLPFLVGMIVSISILRSSGALEAIIMFISPALQMVGIPPDIVPLALIRPISGSAALGMTTEMIATHGPDSFLGRLASTMQGSTDTTLYVLTVYFGAVGIRKMKYALKVGLLADLIAILFSIIIVTMVFG